VLVSQYKEQYNCITISITADNSMTVLTKHANGTGLAKADSLYKKQMVTEHEYNV